MPETSYDVIVIGSGPGGYVAAIRAAQLGLKTAVVESGAVGGRCLNVACIPAKAVLRSADILSEINAGDFGLNVAGVEVDFAAISARRARVVKTLTGGVSGLFKKNGIDVIEGHGSVTAEANVKIGGSFDGTEIEARRGVIVATGSVKRPIPGTQFGGRVIGTEEAWALDELPQTLAVVGAGASGTEIASAYARLGSQVALFEGLDRVLPSEDADISKLAERSFKKQDITVHTQTFVENVVTTETSCTFTHGDEAGEAQWLVIAAGRGPDIEGLGLDDAGVRLDGAGLIAVSGEMRTSIPHVWAIGDLVPGPALAHKASDEGIIAAEDCAGMATHPITYVDVPRATFCQPNVASFGLTEEQAREQGHDVVVGKLQYGAVGAGTVYGDRTGLIKIVGDKRYGELLGGHIVGSKATELIQELVNVRALEGGYSEVARMVHGHPTLSEGVMEAARDADGWLIHGDAQAAFYFDLGSPEAYLAAEQVNHALDAIPEWIPVRASGLPAPEGFDAWRCADDELAYRDTVERRAAAAGLQPLRWPDPFPFDSDFAMRVAWYAKSIGRAVAFAHAAFRQAYAGGRTLGEPDNVLIAASACEMHPAAVLKGAQLRSVGQGLDDATRLAAERGVRDVPAVWLPDGRVLHGVEAMAVSA